MHTAVRFFLYISILFFLHCPLTNKIFLKPSRVNGNEAKLILNNRLASLFVNDISTGSNNSLANDFLMSTLVGIQEDKVYSRRDVESCATKIFLAALAIDQPSIVANRTKKASDPLRTSDPNSRLYPPMLCQLKAIDKLIDLD